MDRLLIDHLVSSGLTSRADVQRKILKAKALKVSVLAQMFEEKIDETKMAGALAEYFKSEVLPEDVFDVNDTALKFLSQKMANKHGVLPYQVSDSADHVTVAVYDPESAGDVLKTLKTATGSEPKIMIARKSWLEGAIRHYYFGEHWAEKPEEILELEPEPEVEPEPEPVANAGINPIGKLKPKRRTIITPVSTAIPAQQNDQSAEILLDDVVAMQQKQRKPEQSRPTPPPQPDDRKQTKPGSEVDRALDDFDAFLNQSAKQSQRLVDPNLSDIPGWTSPPEEQNGWAGGGADNRGFDLFSDPASEVSANSSLEGAVDQHAVLIAQLRKDIEQQRGIIQALVDILAESRLVSKREIKRRIDSGS